MSWTSFKPGRVPADTPFKHPVDDLRLPAMLHLPDHSTQLADEPEEAADGAKSGVRILIVEDNPGDAYLVRHALDSTELDVELDHVTTLAAAEERLRGASYDAVLLDLGLPDVRGPQTVERARALVPETPVVVLTGHGEDEVMRAALQADADDFLPKAEITSTSLSRSLRHARERRLLAGALHEQKRQLEDSEQRLRSVLATISDGVAVVDRDGRVLYSNEAFRQVAGSAAADGALPGLEDERTVLIELQPEDAQDEESVREVEVKSAPILWDGEMARVASLRDVTERRRMESRLHTAQRMEAVGQLAGGMAHEINNVLAVVLANTGLLAQGTPAMDSEELVAEIDRSARRGKALLQRLLAVGRRQRLEIDTIDVGELATDLSGTLQRVLPRALDFELDVSDEDLRVRADAHALEQILLNLVNNARDAMPNGGRVTVRVEHRAIDEEHAARRLGLNAGTYVCVSVADSGVGMDEETLERAFEPFFTTKARDEGTGLGLPTVYGLVKQQGGYIGIDSAPDDGTLVEVFLPTTVAARRGGATALRAKPLTGGEETILLVEDEPTLRRAAARVLRRFGYQVIEAADGVEALEALRTDRDAIDLVISDVVMPRLGGRGLFEAMRQLTGPPPVIFVSGYSAEDLRDGELLDPSFDLLPKPWTVPELLDRVRRALASA